MIDRTYIFAILLFSIFLAIASAQASSTIDQKIEVGITAHKNGDYKHAKSILLPLAEVGHPKAINIIGMMYDFGTGFSINADTACNLYTRSAELGYAAAMYNLSHCYKDGRGKALNPDVAHEWVIKAAENGLVQAMLHLATEPNSTKQDRRHWLNNAAHSGSTYAKAMLWVDGYREDVPDFSFFDSLCVRIKILTFHQGVDACDD